jgi:hypothetical protein
MRNEESFHFSACSIKFRHDRGTAHRPSLGPQDVGEVSHRRQPYAKVIRALLEVRIVDPSGGVLF